MLPGRDANIDKPPPASIEAIVAALVAGQEAANEQLREIIAAVHSNTEQNNAKFDRLTEEVRDNKEAITSLTSQLELLGVKMESKLKLLEDRCS